MTTASTSGAHRRGHARLPAAGTLTSTLPDTDLSISLTADSGTRLRTIADFEDAGCEFLGRLRPPARLATAGRKAAARADRSGGDVDG